MLSEDANHPHSLKHVISAAIPALPAAPPYAPLPLPPPAPAGSSRLTRCARTGVQAGMLSHDTSAPDTSVPDTSAATGQPSAGRNRLVLIVYTAAIFVSALLLFSVQPLFTKMVLPRLGGSPAVWSVAMVFFQSLLLAGYAYAHYLMQLRNRMIPVAVHLVLLVVALLTLPLSIAGGWGEPPASAMRSGCSACSRSRSGCRSLRWRPTIRCCRPGSSAPAIPTVPIPTSSMPPRISAVSWRCCPIRCCWSRCSRCARKT